MSQPQLQRRLAKALSALEDVPDLLSRLEAVREAREALEQLEAETARRARESGVTWGQIGALYGVSKQAAQQRFRAPKGRARDVPPSPGDVPQQPPTSGA